MSGSVCQQFSKMIMVRFAKLIFYYDHTLTTYFLSDYIASKVTNCLFNTH